MIWRMSDWIWGEMMAALCEKVDRLKTDYEDQSGYCVNIKKEQENQSYAICWMYREVNQQISSELAQEKRVVICTLMDTLYSSLYSCLCKFLLEQEAFVIFYSDGIKFLI